MPKPITLPSGVKLEITPSSFPVARELYQAILEEMKGTKLDPLAEVDANLWKDLFCVALSSKKIEDALWKCMDRVMYGKSRVTLETFEPVEARGDYIQVCFEVAKENVAPFMKSLYAEYGQALAKIKNFQA